MSWGDHPPLLSELRKTGGGIGDWGNSPQWQYQAPCSGYGRCQATTPGASEIASEEDQEDGGRLAVQWEYDGLAKRGSWSVG